MAGVLGDPRLADAGQHGRGDESGPQGMGAIDFAVEADLGCRFCGKRGILQEAYSRSRIYTTRLQPLI